MATIRPHRSIGRQTTGFWLPTPPPTPARVARTSHPIPLRSYGYAYCQTRAVHQHAGRTPVVGMAALPLSSRAPMRTETPRIAPNRARSQGVSPTIVAKKTKDKVLYSTQATELNEPTVHSVFEKVTGTWQYVVADPSTKAAAIIDSVLDYDPVSLAISTRSADALLKLVKEKGYRIDWILDTHAHADHLSAAAYLQSKLAKEQQHRPPIGIGKRIGQVQKTFSLRYEVPTKEYELRFDKLFDDDEVFNIGNMKAMAIHLPGHTPDHLGYKIGDNVFCGDTVFNADVGTARCDFPGGSVNSLWESTRKLLQMPDNVKIWTGHDYPPEERSEPVPFMTVKEHRERNRHVKDGTTKEEFVAMRTERDASLKAPRLLHQSLQINIRAGHLPEPTEAGLRLLRTPLKVGDVEF